MISFLSDHVPFFMCPLAGNSVSQDRKFIDKYLPKVAAHLHYRTVDVSTIKEVCKRWHPTIFTNAPAKALNHRSLDDIYESIKELEYYRDNLFVEVEKCE